MTEDLLGAIRDVSRGDKGYHLRQVATEEEIGGRAMTLDYQKLVFLYNKARNFIIAVYPTRYEAENHFNACEHKEELQIVDTDMYVAKQAIEYAMGRLYGGGGDKEKKDIEMRQTLDRWFS